MLCESLYEIPEKTNYIVSKQISSGRVKGWGERTGLTAKGLEGNLKSDGHSLLHNFGYTTTTIISNSSNCML
jgi:hypothetical protein